MIEAKLSIASTSSGGEGTSHVHKFRKVFRDICHVKLSSALYHFVVLESDCTMILYISLSPL